VRLLPRFIRCHAQSATEDLDPKAQRLVAPLVQSHDSQLQQVATFEHQVTGVTVAGRCRALSPTDAVR
jgi:hypothetical protein